MRRFGAGVILFWVMLGPRTISFAAAPATAPSAATTTSATTTVPAPVPLPAGRRAADPTRHPAIQPAIVTLTKEIESALRKGEDAPRGQSDYFQTEPAADLPSAAVIAALRRPIASDPRVAAYVKWQLLSGLPAELDAKTAADMIVAYRTAAPEPLPRTGMEKAQRDELDRMVRNARENEADALTERFEQLAERGERDNKHILAYRDALFAKLPPSYDALAAGFEDAVVRMNAGVDPAEHTRAVCKIVTHWADTAAPDQMKQMLHAIRQLEKKKGPEYYSRLYWSDSNARLQWTRTAASFSGISQLEAAQDELVERIKNPTVPLKLKEEK